MNIGIVGLGVVGKAVRAGLEKIGNRIFVHDLKMDTSVRDIIPTEIIFICVPTPQGDDGSCDTSNVQSVLKDLSDINYKGIVAIKSTVEVGFTNSMIDKFKNLTICFVPEFLRERCAEADFVENHQLLAIGTNDPFVFNRVSESHGSLPKNFVQLTTTEAEILKYYNNVFAATKIIFANLMNDICEKTDADYTKVKQAFIKTGRAKDSYLDVNANLKGYGGMCLPKDVKAMISLCKKLKVNFDLFTAVDKDNSRLKTTVFNGMRKR
jgi:UDPglucose 6-dehydrogenase